MKYTCPRDGVRKAPWRTTRSRRGSTLSVALLLVLAASLISIAVLQRGLQQWRLQATSSDEKMAFYMAEAGVAEAIDAIRDGGSGNVGTLQSPALFGSGAFWVETVTDEHDVSFVTSTGLHDGTPYRLCQAVQKPELPLVKWGFFGQYEVEVGENAIVRSFEVPPPGTGGSAPTPNELGTQQGAGGVAPSTTPTTTPTLLGGSLLGGSSWFDSMSSLLGSTSSTGSTTTKKSKNNIALPEPAPVQAEPALLLGSDGPIHLQPGASVEGSATPGPESSVLFDGTSYVSGAVLPDQDRRELPTIAMPMDVSSGDLTLTLGQTTELTGAALAYSAIDVQSGATLRLVGPVAISMDSLHVRGNGTVEFVTTGGPVHIYVDQSVLVAAGGQIDNQALDPSKVLMLVAGRNAQDLDGNGVTGSPVEWNSNQQVCLTLYAPHTMLSLPAGIHWIGSVVAQTLTVGAGALLELDARIAAVKVVARDYELLSWRVVSIPAAERALLAQDPVKKARLAGTPLSQAWSARIAPTQVFAFVDAAGQTLKYMGDTLADLTLKVPVTLVPVVAEASDVPEFGSYAQSSTEVAAQGATQASAAQFQNVWDYMMGHLGLMWTFSLVTGAISPSAWDEVVNKGNLIEPIKSVVSDPSVKSTLESSLATSWAMPATKQFLQAAVALVP